ncbi:hypothetical protein [Massilia sp. DD77]|uniref:hypothetical protein n=1 Tax=Massilia sp. DD77 TaxID=3109349 RepID=UPI002FFD930B
MNRINGPRPGTRAHAALLHLDGAGLVSAAALMGAVNWKRNSHEFTREIVDALVRLRVAEITGASIAITRLGQLYLRPPAVEAAPQLQLVTGRYVPPQRALSAQNRPRVVSMRPGALDYREIPSRMSSQLLQHGEKAVA